MRVGSATERAVSGASDWRHGYHPEVVPDSGGAPDRRSCGRHFPRRRIKSMPKSNHDRIGPLWSTRP